MQQCLRWIPTLAVALLSACSDNVGDGSVLNGMADAGAEDAANTSDSGVNPSDGGSDAGSGSSDAGPGTDASVDSGVVTTVFGLDQRPSNANCEAPPRPGAQGLAKATLSLSGTTTQMTDLRRVPDPIGGWLLIERRGVMTYVSDGGDVEAVLDSSDLTNFTWDGSEQGLLGLAVDPLFPNSVAQTVARIYVNYTGDCDPQCKTIVSRFQLTYGGDGSITVSDEEELLRVLQPAGNHNGGALVFGDDNMLYISFGDGGSGNDPWCSGLNPWSPLGKIFRIDVHSSPTGYTVPTDNPWYADPDTDEPYPRCNNHVNGPPPNAADESRNQPCPETIAMGLRNPFRMSFDDVGSPNDNLGGHLWIGDVGQDVYEEVSHFAPRAAIQAGRPTNFGWPYREAVRVNDRSINRTSCQRLEELGLVDETTFVPPTYYYDQSSGGGTSVAAGVVYRGAELGPVYAGRFLFADVISGNVWFMPDPYAASEVDVTGMQQGVRFTFPYGFAEDQNQEVIALVGPPAERRLVSAAVGPPLPTLLSQTGCVNPTDPSQPASGLIPYSIDVPLWSDGASKERYVAVPDGEQITVGPDGDLELPIGSVAVKIFRDGSGRLLETRYMYHHDEQGWAGYTYVWRDDESEADLATGEEMHPSVDWLVPSRGQCLECHTIAAGGSLGLELRQLAGNHLYPSTGRVADQIETWNHIGLFADTVDRAAWAPLSDDPARGYLHSNCSNCHRPGAAPSNMDLRASTALADMAVCDVLPTRTEEPNLRLLAPGEPGRSLLSLRPRSTTSDRMPPIGTRIVDEASMDMIDAWINGLSACP